MTAVRLMKPYITFEEVEADFREVFDSGMFTRGQHVEAFRKELAAFTGARNVHMTTSATTALWVCLKLLNIGLIPLLLALIAIAVGALRQRRWN